MASPKRWMLRWTLLLVILFVAAQFAGLLHAEVHDYHEHEVSCDLFDNLIQPFSSTTYLPNIEQLYSVSYLAPVPLVSRAANLHINHFFGRAPPVSL